MLNIFPRIIKLEVALTAPQIMQAIRDNMIKENSNWQLLIGKNSNVFDGYTSGKQFDIRRAPKQRKDYIWLHGELTELADNKTEMEVSSYPLVPIGLPIIIFLVAIFVGVSVLVFGGKEPITDKVNLILLLLIIQTVGLSIYYALFIYDFNRSVNKLKLILYEAERQQNKKSETD